MDVKFFKPFVEATLNTLKVQCGITATYGKPFKKGDQPQPVFEITGVIGMTSSAFCGTIALCFPSAVYLGIMQGMLGEPMKEITPEIQDGAAELLNIIYGSAKVQLNNQGYTIDKAIPTVVRGAALQTSYLDRRIILVLPFSTPFGEFHLEVGAEGGS